VLVSVFLTDCPNYHILTSGANFSSRVSRVDELCKHLTFTSRETFFLSKKARCPVLQLHPVLGVKSAWVPTQRRKVSGSWKRLRKLRLQDEGKLSKDPNRDSVAAVAAGTAFRFQTVLEAAFQTVLFSWVLYRQSRNITSAISDQLPFTTREVREGPLLYCVHYARVLVPIAEHLAVRTRD